MFIDTIVAFFNHPFFIVVGGLVTILMIFGFFYTAYLVVKGVFPVWYRLGVGLSKRKVAVFGSLEVFESIRASLIDSKNFQRKKCCSHQTGQC